MRAFPLLWQRWQFVISKNHVQTPRLYLQLLPTEVLYIAWVGNFARVCCCDLDLDPMTFIYELGPYRRTYRHTDRRHRNYFHVASWVVTISVWILVVATQTDCRLASGDFTAEAGTRLRCHPARDPPRRDTYTLWAIITARDIYVTAQPSRRIFMTSPAHPSVITSCRWRAEVVRRMTVMPTHATHVLVNGAAADSHT